VEVERAPLAAGPGGLLVDHLALVPTLPAVEVGVAIRAVVVEVSAVGIAVEPGHGRVVRHPAKVGTAIRRLVGRDRRPERVGQLRLGRQSAAVVREAGGQSVGLCGTELERCAVVAQVVRKQPQPAV